MATALEDPIPKGLTPATYAILAARLAQSSRYHRAKVFWSALAGSAESLQRDAFQTALEPLICAGYERVGAALHR